MWVDPKKNIDPRLINPDESPEGHYIGMIVPEYLFNKTMFLIEVEELNKILEYLKKNQNA